MEFSEHKRRLERKRKLKGISVLWRGLQQVTVVSSGRRRSGAQNSWRWRATTAEMPEWHVSLRGLLLFFSYLNVEGQQFKTDLHLDTHLGLLLCISNLLGFDHVTIIPLTLSIGVVNEIELTKKKKKKLMLFWIVCQYCHKTWFKPFEGISLCDN